MAGEYLAMKDECEGSLGRDFARAVDTMAAELARESESGATAEALEARWHASACGLLGLASLHLSGVPWLESDDTCVKTAARTLTVPGDEVVKVHGRHEEAAWRWTYEIRAPYPSELMPARQFVHLVRPVGGRPELISISGASRESLDLEVVVQLLGTLVEGVPSDKPQYTYDPGRVIAQGESRPPAP